MEFFEDLDAYLGNFFLALMVFADLDPTYWDGWCLPPSHYWFCNCANHFDIEEIFDCWLTKMNCCKDLCLEYKEITGQDIGSDFYEHCNPYNYFKAKNPKIELYPFSELSTKLVELNEGFDFMKRRDSSYQWTRIFRHMEVTSHLGFTQGEFKFIGFCLAQDLTLSQTIRMLKYYRGLDVPLNFTDIKANLDVGFFGTPYHTPRQLSTAIFHNSPVVFKQLLFNNAPHLKEVITIYSFSQFHKFIAHTTPFEQMVWLERGQKFTVNLKKPLKSFQLNFDRITGNNLKRLGKIRNLVLQLNTYVLKNREEYDTPAIEITQVHLDTLAKAIREFPVPSTYFYKFLQTQPAGLVFLQELLFTLLTQYLDRTSNYFAPEYVT